MSFRLQTGLSQDDYNNLLVIAGLLMKDKTYGGYRVEANEWKTFVSEIADEAEFDGAVILRNICGSSKRYYIRLVPKRQGYKGPCRTRACSRAIFACSPWDDEASHGALGGKESPGWCED